MHPRAALQIKPPRHDFLSNLCSIEQHCDSDIIGLIARTFGRCSTSCCPRVGHCRDLSTVSLSSVHHPQLKRVPLTLYYGISSTSACFVTAVIYNALLCISRCSPDYFIAHVCPPVCCKGFPCRLHVPAATSPATSFAYLKLSYSCEIASPGPGHVTAASLLADVTSDPSGPIGALPFALSCRWNIVLIVRLERFVIVCLSFCLADSFRGFASDLCFVDGLGMRRRGWISTISFARGTGAA